MALAHRSEGNREESVKRNSLSEQPSSLMSDSGPDGLRARMSQRYRPQLARIPRVTASGCFYRADSLDRYGPGNNGTTFVFPTSEIDSALLGIRPQADSRREGTDAAGSLTQADN